MRQPSREHLVRRAESEFLEMPGLQLTREQAQRLWGVEPDTCREILETLMRRRFLVLGHDHRYRRSFDGARPSLSRSLASPAVSRVHRKAG